MTDPNTAEYDAGLEALAEALDNLVMSRGIALDEARLDWLVEWVSAREAKAWDRGRDAGRDDRESRERDYELAFYRANEACSAREAVLMELRDELLSQAESVESPEWSAYLRSLAEKTRVSPPGDRSAS